MGVKCYLIVVLIYVSLMIEHLIICLLAVHVSSEKCLFRSFAHFFVCLFLVVELQEFFIYSESNPLSDMRFAALLSHFAGCLLFNVQILGQVLNTGGS